MKAEKSGKDHIEKMASETDLTSDCDEGFTTKISDHHLRYLKEAIIQHLFERNSFSAEIQHVPNKPAKLSLTFGSKSGM